MSLDWSRNDDEDVGRTKRLAGSYAAASALVAAVIGVGIVFGGRIKKQVFEEEVDVKFVPPAPVVSKPPPPPPLAAPLPKMAAATPAARGRKREAPPVELPREAPREVDPRDAKPEGPDGEGDPNGVAGGTGRGGGAPILKEVEPVRRTAPAPVLQIAEVSTPPVPIAKKMPAYPEEARKQAIEALVIIKFVVGGEGNVEDVKIVKGHPLFDDVVVAAVRTWTFEPATLDGKAVRMVRMVKIPFRLKHS